MRYLMLLFSAWLSALSTFAQPDTTQRIIPDRFNEASQQQKPYVIMISIDGFRYDYAVKHGAKHILSLANQGIRANGMIPSYPTLTFPNHYSLVTGLYPMHHGLVSNHFFDSQRGEIYGMNKKIAVADGSWYGGTPLWVLAEQQHMLTACLFWVGTEANIQGTLPTYYYNYSEVFSNKRRINIILDWLQLPAEKRPHFITVYFPEVDHAGHNYGPDAPETKAAVHNLDNVIYELTAAVKTIGLPVNYLLVSDHGMTKVDIDHPVSIPHEIDNEKFVIPSGRELMMLYAKQQADIQPTYELLKAKAIAYDIYLPDSTPAYLHFDKAGDRFNRIGDILLMPKWPQIFESPGSKPKLGAHGFDPRKVKDMQAIFYAWGPAFKSGMTIPAFENVHVFPIVTTLLGLEYSEEIDGNKRLAEKILK